MTYTIDNINEFFENLMNSKNAKFNILSMYEAYEREYKENKRKREIEDKYGWHGCNNVAHIVSDDIAIVEQREYDRVAGYFAHVNNKKSSYIWPTFEQALLCAVSIKLTGREDATEWMWKLVGWENNS